MLDCMSNLQFNEWVAYAEIEPFGEERADLRMAIQTAALVNLWRDPSQGSPVEPKDFMPSFEPQEPESKEVVAQNVDALFSALAASGPFPES